MADAKTQSRDDMYVEYLKLWFVLESKIKADGLAAIASDPRRPELVGQERVDHFIQWWAELAGEIGSEYIQIHKYLDPALHSRQMAWIRFGTKDSRMNAETREKLDLVWKQHRGDEAKTPMPIAQKMEVKKRQFTFDRSVNVDDELTENYKSISFQTIRGPPYLLYTIHFTEPVTEDQMYEAGEKWLSEPLTREYYEARQKYTKDQLPWEKQTYKIRGDLLEGLVLRSYGFIPCIMTSNGTTYKQLADAVHKPECRAPEYSE